jgi:hypothetical protein
MLKGSSVPKGLAGMREITGAAGVTGIAGTGIAGTGIAGTGIAGVTGAAGLRGYEGLTMRGSRARLIRTG